MDSKELRILMEAYSQVYAPQEETVELEEGLRSAVKRLLGKKEEPAEKKPESRGEYLRRKYNVGPDKSDTSAKRQILNRSRARAEKDERDYGDSKYSKSVAVKSKAAHDRYLRAGYSKYGADLKHGSGNKARKRAAVLQNNEFEWLIDSLLDEGYDLSMYTVEEFYDFCCEEFEFEVFDTILEFLINEEIAQDLQEATWIMSNVLTEEQIDEILGMFKKKKKPDINRGSATEFAGRSMTSTPKKKPYDVITGKYASPRHTVHSYGGGGAYSKTTSTRV